METPGPTALSLIGAGVYVAVAALSGRAALNARTGCASTHDFRWWMAIGLLFLILAAMRVLVVEDHLREALRVALASIELYETRRALQWPLAIVILTGFSLVCWRFWQGFPTSDDTRERVLWAAKAGCFAMISLVAIRLISLGPIDYMLDGRLRINWWIDIGSSLVVAWAAWSYRNATRDDEIRR